MIVTEDTTVCRDPEGTVTTPPGSAVLGGLAARGAGVEHQLEVVRARGGLHRGGEGTRPAVTWSNSDWSNVCMP